MARATNRTRRSSGYYMRLRQTTVKGEPQPRNDLLKRLMAAQDRGNGWSIRQLAGAAGVPASLIGFLVKGARGNSGIVADSCSEQTAKRIAQALGVDIYVLFEERPSRRDTRR